MKAVGVSRYHIVVGAIYILVTAAFFAFMAHPVRLFVWHNKDAVLLFELALGCFASLFILNRTIGFGRLAFHKRSIAETLLVAAYALAFAVPEEIIFRWAIQGALVGFVSTAAAIVLSSLAYAYAHILNGARSLRPADWNWKLVYMTFVAGIFLGIACASTGSLMMPIILHALIIVADRTWLVYH
jgi:membrane protease YdiL (CAAX protease family)